MIYYRQRVYRGKKIARTHNNEILKFTLAEQWSNNNNNGVAAVNQDENNLAFARPSKRSSSVDEFPSLFRTLAARIHGPLAIITSEAASAATIYKGKNRVNIIIIIIINSVPTSWYYTRKLPVESSCNVSYGIIR